MAFKSRYNPDNEIQEGMTSKFNEAFLKMHRIHKLQDSMNLAWINPLAYHNELGMYNYQIILSCCDSIYEECYGKLSEEERADMESFRSAMEFLLDKSPIVVPIKNNSNHQTTMRINEKNFKIVKKWIFEYKKKVRELLSITGYDSPNKSELDDDDF